jgi:prolyl-tRNA synthetase
MKQSQAFICTLRDAPADAEVASHKLLAQAGFILKLTSGVYSYTPAMWRTLRKISQIVREEMDAAGAQELMLPILQPTSIWEESGRLDRYVDDGILFHFKDRKDTPVCLGPTHEEVITMLARQYVSSYKQLPINLYQMQTKFRDEIRPRFGIMRGREFIMKDAYSFDADQEGLDKSYEAMRVAYHNVCERIGLAYRAVEADSGAIGGSGSSEFMVLADTGEDTILYCDSCEYAANQEKAGSLLEEFEQDAEQVSMEEVEGKGLIGVDALAEFLNIPVWKTTKTILFMADNEPVAVMVRGDCDVNEIKVQNALGGVALRLCTPEEVKELTGAEVGYAGPIGLPEHVKILADTYVNNRVNFECGANKTDFHNINVNFGRDVDVPEFGDFKLAKAGDACSCCNGKLQEARGIEVGHIFKLGTKYSEAMGASFMDNNGKDKPLVMGCYGIGISRIAASAIEQRHDEDGIIWPKEIAPYSAHVICLNPKKDEQRELADNIYTELLKAGVDVLYDDRKVSTGVKFKDADLIGIPLRVVVGRGAADGEVEYCTREATREKITLSASDAVERVKAEWVETRI